jgi:sugar (pentulose or hexulose) kinase
MSTPLIALFDVGKTNTKLSLIDPHSNKEVWSTRRANASLQSEHGRQLDLAGIERWLLDVLRSAPHKDRIASIVPVAHGAAAVLLDSNGDVIAAPDYEDACFESVNADYERTRDPFARTFSPNLPLGLNLGRQLFFLQQTRAPLFNRSAHVLLYPQYWAWRLSGVLASEVTSLGCHTDLWLPNEQAFSELALRCGWSKVLPPIRFAGDKLGKITSTLAATTGLDSSCEVACGIHDSNASYLRFLIGREQEPFTVVSSGTWTIVMANRGDLSRLQEERDMLANVDAFGAPVATARFMGGREYELIAQNDALPSAEGLNEVIQRRALALPSFASGGPFRGYEGRLLNAEDLSDSGRAALATIYSALMTALLVESLGAAGDILIDGPLASNPLFGPLLAALTSVRAVKICSERGGARFATYLAGFTSQQTEPLRSVEPLDAPGLARYRNAWRDKIGR